MTDLIDKEHSRKLILILIYCLICGCKSRLVCPETCDENCDDNEDSNSNTFINFKCLVGNVTANFKFNRIPQESSLHILDKVAVNRDFINGFRNFYSIYLDNLNLTNTDITEDFFDFHSHLKIISITGNPFLTNIPPNIFDGKKELFAIVLSNNNLKHLSLPTQIPKLERIFLTGNQIELSDNIFFNFPLLSRLFLKNNNITHLPHKLLHNLKKLDTLDLSRNQISEIPYNFFKNSRMLKQLFLQENGLVSLSDDFSYGLIKIQSLDLSHNQISDISENSFQSLLHLHKLILNHNKLKEFKDFTFYSLLGLNELDLSFNELEITGLPRISSKLFYCLNLSYNQIRIFHDSFPNCDRKYFVDLNLSNNKIEYLDIKHYKCVINSMKNSALVGVYNRKFNDGRKDKQSQIRLENNPISRVNLQCLKSNLLIAQQHPNYIYIDGEKLTCQIRKLICESKVKWKDLVQFKFTGDNFCETDFQKNCSISHENCHQNCTCLIDNSSKNYIIDCTGGKLDLIPSIENFVSVKELRMDENRLSNLTSFLHTTWRNLTFVSLNYCQIQSKMLMALNNNSVFGKMINLKHISLSHNFLTYLPVNIFSELNELEFLDLSHNNIQTIPFNLFNSFANKLSILSLSNNQLKTMDNLESLFNVKFLNLNSNYLTGITSINTLKNLQEFHAENNSITNLTEFNVFIELKVLTLNQNWINKIGNESISNVLNFLNLKNNKLQEINFASLNLPSRIIVDLTENSIKKVQFEASKCFLIQHFFLMNNPFQCDCDIKEFIDYYKNESYFCGLELPVPEGKRLKCFDSNFCCRPQNCQCSLQEFTSCTKIPNEKDKFFSDIGDKLELKGISFNDLYQLNLRVWDKLTNLRIINSSGTTNNFLNFTLRNKSSLTEFSLTNSNLLTLSNDFLQHALNLKYLDLSSNQIVSIPESFFSNSKKLEIINLSKNNITEIFDDLFANLESLEILKLKNNAIREINSKTFKNNLELKELDLSSNKIINLNENSFTRCTELKVVNLSDNILGKENLIHLNFPPDVEYLDFSHNGINTLNARLSHLLKLKEFDISSNHITEININQFVTYRSNSLTINLENNNLTTLDYSSGNVTLNVVAIKLNSPLNCDCRLDWLLNCIGDKVQPNCPIRLVSEDVKCGYPEELKGFEIFSLNSSDLKCYLPSEKCPNECVKCYVQQNLNTVNCSNSNLTEIPKMVDEYNTHNLYLDYNVNISLDKLKSDQFKNLTGLFVSNCISFGSDLDENLLTETKMLSVIWMNYDGIKNIPDNFFNGLSNLTELQLIGNFLTTLSENWFVDLVKLHQFSVSKNEIEWFKKELFVKNVNLKNIDLSLNRLKLIDIVNSELNFLNLSRNLIENFDVKKYLILDLSFNHIMLIDLGDYNGSKIYLNNNLLQNISFPKSKSSTWLIEISNNPISCNCVIREKKKFQTQIISNDDCRQKFNLEEEICLLDLNCPTNCTCIKTESIEISINCSHNHYNFLPSHSFENSNTSVTSLHMEYNDIETLTGLNNSMWSNLHTLNLTHNKIHTISNEILPRTLKSIELSHNKLTHLSGWLTPELNQTSNINKLTLRHNPWSCTCDNERFQKWLKSTKGQKTVIDVNDITCDNTTNFLQATLCEDEYENWKVTVLPALTSISIILLISIIVISYYCTHKKAVRSFLYSQHCFKFFFSEDESDRDKKFDAFISYASEDTDFVVQTLMPELESKPPYYKLCVHERDWRVGEQILDQIEESVTNSKRVIIVLSENFVKSMWSSMEFKTAHYYSIKEKVNRIIVIVLGELPPKEKLDNDLKLYINLNTYLKWGDSRFWQKLHYAMPHKLVSSRSGNV